jgi:hypothetical protein
MKSGYLSRSLFEISRLLLLKVYVVIFIFTQRVMALRDGLLDFQEKKLRYSFLGEVSYIAQTYRARHIENQMPSYPTKTLI